MLRPDEQAERDVDAEYDRFCEMLTERHMTLEQYLATCPTVKEATNG